MDSNSPVLDLQYTAPTSRVQAAVTFQSVTQEYTAESTIKRASTFNIYRKHFNIIPLMQ